MPRQTRSDRLTALQDALGFPVLSFVTGDRPNLQTQISADQLPRFPRHLRAIGDHKSVGLLLHTRGGETHAAWPLVNFLREHCTELTVLVPMSAHSAGTLIALGADRIVMSRYATLSPIDPTIVGPYNEAHPQTPQLRLPISVEDVMAYFELAEGHGVKGERAAEVFLKLSDKVHPLALGNVERSVNQIRELARKMLSLHPPARSDVETKELIHRLTTGLYSHYHLVSRREAVEIGLPVEQPEKRVNDLLDSYYAALVEDLDLLDPFNPVELVQAAAAGGAPGHQPPLASLAGSSTTVRAERAYIETPSTCDAFVTEGTITVQPAQQQQMVMVPGMPAPVPLGAGGTPSVSFEVTREGWRESDTPEGPPGGGTDEEAQQGAR